MPRTLADTGSEAAANTLLTDWISEKIVFSALTMAVPPEALVVAKYLPLPLTAMLCSRAVMFGAWPVEPGSTSTV